MRPFVLTSDCGRDANPMGVRRHVGPLGGAIRTRYQNPGAVHCDVSGSQARLRFPCKRIALRSTDECDHVSRKHLRGIHHAPHCCCHITTAFQDTYCVYYRCCWDPLVLDTRGFADTPVVVLVRCSRFPFFPVVDFRTIEQAGSTTERNERASYKQPGDSPPTASYVLCDDGCYNLVSIFVGRN